MLWGPYNLEKPDWYDWQPQRKTDYRSYQVRMLVLLLPHALHRYLQHASTITDPK